MNITQVQNAKRTACRNGRHEFAIRPNGPVRCDCGELPDFDDMVTKNGVFIGFASDVIEFADLRRWGSI